MSKPLRLLVVEDSEAEVAPLVRELRRHGYEPNAVRVDAADAMRNALNVRRGMSSLRTTPAGF